MSIVKLTDCENKDNYDALAIIKEVVCVSGDDMSVSVYDVQAESCTPLASCSSKDNWDLDSLLKELTVIDSGKFKIKVSSV